MLLLKHIYDEDPGIFATFLDSRYLMIYPEEIISIIEFITDQVTQKTIKKEANIEFCQDLLKARDQNLRVEPSAEIIDETIIFRRTPKNGLNSL